MVFGTPKIINVEEVVDKNPDLYLKRAEDFLKRGNLKQALIECDLAIKYSNYSGHYVFEKIKVLNHSGHYAECISMIKRHVNNFKREFTQDKLGEVYLYLYYCHKKQGNKRDGRYFGVKPSSGFGVFSNDNEVYVGDWLNHKRHGYGMSFSGADLTFEGKWDNDHHYHMGRVAIQHFFTISGVILFSSALLSFLWAPFSNLFENWEGTDFYAGVVTFYIYGSMLSNSSKPKKGKKEQPGAVFFESLFRVVIWAVNYRFVLFNEILAVYTSTEWMGLLFAVLALIHIILLLSEIAAQIFYKNIPYKVYKPLGPIYLLAFIFMILWSMDLL